MTYGQIIVVILFVCGFVVLNSMVLWKVQVTLSSVSICVSALDIQIETDRYRYFVDLICHAFHQVTLAVEGSAMSGSLQRRKKSKRKWKRLWFLLKDKVLYTFTTCEVRGHRVSHTSPKTLTHSHDHSITEAFPHQLYPSIFFCTSGQCSAFPLFNLSSWAEHFMWLMKGFSVLSVWFDMCASECSTALFSMKHEASYSHIAADSKIAVFNLHACVFILASSG